MEPKIFYYLNGTHWDREWYRPFQGFRYLLMRVLDEVIETLEGNPDFKLYTLDGQTAVLDDYLEISPERRSRLEALIRSGRIAVGPWYTMPDEYNCSGESLIRNLLVGHAKAKEYGAEQAMKYGYICDIFGHIAQMPQIFAGFGIHGALIQRAINMDTTPPHFIWQSPDGTQCYTNRTPEDFGYGWFYHYATEPYNQGWDLDKEHLLERAIQIIDKEKQALNIPVMVLNDALDHQHITKAAPWLAKKLEEHYGAEVRFVTLDDMVKLQESYSDSLPVKAGEMAETSRLAVGTNILLTYVLSSRHDIKKLNDETQNIWEKWAEPLSAIHAIEGCAIRPGFRRVAYLELLRNHAHDSICGCSVEEVHRDMHYRYRQAITIAEEIIDDCLRQDVAALTDNDDPKKMIVRIFNPLPYQSRQTVKLRLCFEKNFPATFCDGEREYERRPNFELFDKTGKVVPFTLCGVTHDVINKTATQYVVDYVDICINADLLPCGYTEYAVLPADKTRRVRYIESQCVAPLAAENKYLRLSLNSDGTVNITDKRSGRSFRDLLHYIDDGEIGDGWMHIRPAADRIVYSQGSPCIIEKLYDGPAETAFRIFTRLQLPVGMEYDMGHHIHRSEHYVEVPIATTVRLGAENDWVDVQTVVENTAMDHRLKVCFPTDIPGDTYLAGQAFTVLERPVGQLDHTGDWKEPEYGDRNCNGIAAKRAADGTGLAILAAYGMHEVQAMSDERRTLAMTLYRSFTKTIGNNDYTKIDGELLQKLEFTYRLMPLTAETSEGSMIRCRDFLQAGQQSYSAFVNENYALCAKPGFAELEGDDLALSIMKTPEDNEDGVVVLRLYNCSDREAQGTVRFARDILRAWQTDMLEQPNEELCVQSNSLILQVPARKIVTMRVKLA